jgi:hypothetical protein
MDDIEVVTAWLKQPQKGRRDPRTSASRPALTDAGYDLSARRALVRWAGPSRALVGELRRPEGPVCNSPRPSGPGEATGRWKCSWISELRTSSIEPCGIRSSTTFCGGRRFWSR